MAIGHVLFNMDCGCVLTLTVSILQRLFLLGRFGDDLDSLAQEHSDVAAVAVQHPDRQHEVLSLVRVTDVQGLGRAEVLLAREIKSVGAASRCLMKDDDRKCE